MPIAELTQKLNSSDMRLSSADNILSAIGQTPLVKLQRLFNAQNIECYAKLEGLNPAGSTKDRSSKAIIEHALQSGQIGRGSIVVESSSGNMGIGLAQVCAYYKIKFICVVDRRASKLNCKIMQAYGAEVRMVEDPDPETGDYLTARLKLVNNLVNNLDQAFWPNQYANEQSYQAHLSYTMPEIHQNLGRLPDYLFCATSTCSTIRGCVEYVKQQQANTKIIAVDALGSKIFGDSEGRRLIPGMGADRQPPLCPYPDIATSVLVSDLDCILGCRQLVKYEAIFAGASSGGVISAAKSYLATIKKNADCVLILADRGERYIDTIYSDTWVKQQLGEINLSI